MTRKRTPKPSAHVVEGLNDIYSYMGAEHEAHDLTMFECVCPGCRVNEECECWDKPYASKCQECQCYENIAAALSWIGTVINRHRKD